MRGLWLCYDEISEDNGPVMTKRVWTCPLHCWGLGC